MPDPVIRILHKFIHLILTIPSKPLHGLQRRRLKHRRHTASSCWAGLWTKRPEDCCVSVPLRLCDIRKRAIKWRPSSTVLSCCVPGKVSVYSVLAGAQRSLSCQSPTCEGFGAGTGEQVEGPLPFAYRSFTFVCTSDACKKDSDDQ